MYIILLSMTVPAGYALSKGSVILRIFLFDELEILSIKIELVNDHLATEGSIWIKTRCRRRYCASR